MRPGEKIKNCDTHGRIVRVGRSDIMNPYVIVKGLVVNNPNVTDSSYKHTFPVPC